VRFVAEALSDDHELSGFDSGRPTLDQWLVEHARTQEVRRTARTFVWHDGDRAVLAHYTLTAHLLRREALPRALGRGGPREIPSVLLARLALDRSLHGQGLGGALLAEALARVESATQTVAARFVVADAIDEPAVAFYEHHGFRRLPEALRLVQGLRDIAAALGRSPSSPAR
jgi:GNAT superfamily N-acetyltransferase